MTGNVTVGRLDDKENPLETIENVRLIVIYNPRKDFRTDGVNEIERIDRFLEKNNSMIVFMGPNTPVLPALDEFLLTWGVKFDRWQDEGGNFFNYMISDRQSSLASKRLTLKGELRDLGGIRASYNSGLFEQGNSPSVIFETPPRCPTPRISDSRPTATTRNKSKDFRIRTYYKQRHDEGYLRRLPRRQKTSNCGSKRHDVAQPAPPEVPPGLIRSFTPM